MNEHHEKAVRLMREAGDELGELWARHWWINNRVALGEGSPETDEHDFRSLTEAAQLVGDRRLEVLSLIGISILFLDTEALGQSIAAATQARGLALHAGLEASAGQASLVLASASDEIGECGRATALYEECRARFQRIGDRRQEALSLAFLAGPKARIESADGAATFLRESVRLSEHLADPRLSGLIALQEGHVWLARASEAQRNGDTGAAERFRTNARKHLAAARHTHVGRGTNRATLLECAVEARHMVRMLERELASTPSPVRSIRIDSEAGTFAVDDLPVVALPAGPILRRALALLVEHQSAHPGRAVHRGEIVRRCWPDERMHPESAARRVRDTMKRLRGLGLEQVIQTGRNGGYLLDPAVTVSNA